MTVENLYSFLCSLVENKVYYGNKTFKDGEDSITPYIVYFEVSKRANRFSDNRPIYYVSNYQVTLVTSKKDIKLEKSIETSFLKEGLVFQLLTEYHSDEGEIFRAYEIKMEEFTNGK